MKNIKWWILFCFFILAGFIILKQLKDLEELKDNGIFVMIPIDLQYSFQETSFSNTSKIILIKDDVIDFGIHNFQSGYYRVKYDINGLAMVDDIVEIKPSVIRNNFLYLPCKLENKHFVLQDIVPFQRWDSSNKKAVYLGVRTNGIGGYYIQGLFDDKGNLIN